MHASIPTSRPQWPRVFRSDYGHEEAAHRFGADPRESPTAIQISRQNISPSTGTGQHSAGVRYRYSILSKEFVSDGNGKLAAVRTVQVL